MLSPGSLVLSVNLDTLVYVFGVFICQLATWQYVMLAR
ncbi:hypothetical protein yfred0001_24260 [Yersinia frederiksenii ATCC 33641]|nr:hypothetical protein yfred0001_24260 [Yersinia frederiksenii ATCC 33641]